MNDTRYSSNSDEWGTPQDKFNEWDKEFNFDFDPCGNFNRILKSQIKMITFNKVLDGLSIPWRNYRVFVNPPYSRNKINLWFKKCYDERNNAELIVLLIPLAKGSTKNFHKYIYPFVEIRFIKGRINFIPLDGQNNGWNAAGSMLCIFRRDKHD